MKRNFDGIASYYDLLAKLLFGNSLRKAQTHFIKRIPENAKVLILGSGTGWIASKVLTISPTLKLTLADASLKMTERAKKKPGARSIEIICGDHNLKFKEPFDAVILPCFLDMFSNERLSEVISSIRMNVKANSIWLVTDFVCRKWWHRIYLWLMYRFFRLTCSIEADGLPNWEEVLDFSELKLQESKSFYSGFIQSAFCLSGGAELSSCPLSSAFSSRVAVSS